MRWLNIEEPTATETAWLAEHFDFHELDLEDVLSTRQRPKIDEYDDYLFMVLHLPRFDKSIGRLNAAELNIFIGPDYVITLPQHPLKPVGRLFSRLSNNSELREEYFSKGAGYLLYEILSESFDYCFPILDKIGFKLDRLQNAIWEERSEDVARDISNVEAGDHRLPQDHQAGAEHAAAAGARPRPLPAGGPRGLLRRHRRLGRADLGPARQLQGGRRGARADQRVGDRPQARTTSCGC